MPHPAPVAGTAAALLDVDDAAIAQAVEEGPNLALGQAGLKPDVAVGRAGPADMLGDQQQHRDGDAVGIDLAARSHGQFTGPKIDDC